MTGKNEQAHGGPVCALEAALAFHRAGHVDRALHAYLSALEIDSGLARAWNNIGGIFRDWGRVSEAVDCFKKAISADGKMAEAHFNLGYVLEENGQFEAATGYYEAALAIRPDDGKALSQLVFLRRSTCLWPGLDEMETRLDALTRIAIDTGGPLAETPFKSIVRTADTAVNAAVARFWSHAATRRVSAAPPVIRSARRPDGRIRVGYLSDRFRNAATAHQMLSLFALHDRKDFVIHAYSYGADDGSRYRRRIERDCDRFVDLAEMDDEAVARRIAGDGVDILVDLKGHTQNGRLGIGARRPAPVQVTWLGFPGPVGGRFFDYVICDRIVVPDADRCHFTECPVRLPHTYYPTDFRQPVSHEPWHRADFGLPEAAVVLASFNQPLKIDPRMFGCWMTILADSPRTVLWLQKKNDTVTANLQREAAARGVDPDRLVFSGPMEKDRHLARIALADLCLDTRIYNGHTTTADALWVGVPVITLLGRHFASRVSASLLTALGVPELIARDLDGYRDLALGLASDARARQALRNRIFANRRSMPLFDTPRFVRHLEAGYRQMWRRHCQGRQPRPFDVEALP
ncbi:MAG: tetratricopeptide repeat protein [Desulfobacterales bacterium]|nr:tetratricopeptide repeat protein [Desulfobacterales bacterium]